MNRPQPSKADVGRVIARLEAAGRTLLALPLPKHGLPGGYRCGWPEPVREFADLVGRRDEIEIRAPVPDTAAIAAMDEALGWLPLVEGNARRVVFARMQVHPVTGKQRYSYRRIGRALGMDHKAVQRIYAQAVLTIAIGIAQTPQT